MQIDRNKKRERQTKRETKRKRERDKEGQTDRGTNMAVASGLAGPVLAGPVFGVSDFKTAHARVINNQVKIIDH